MNDQAKAPARAKHAERSPRSPAGPPAAAPPLRINDLEIKDAQLIFGAVWQELEAEFGRENLRFPKEIILLGGRARRRQGHQHRASSERPAG